MVSLTKVGGAAGAKITRSLSNTADAAMNVATSAGVMGAAILIPLGLATKAAMDFEKQMGNVATIVDTTKESMSAMGDEVLDIASRVPVKISDLTESLYQIRSAGISAADAMHVLETSARLSVAGLSSATDATKAVTSAMVAFKAEGLSADQIANSFFLTVKQGKTKMDALNESFGLNAAFVASAGVKLDDFNSATAALTVTGMSASEAQNGLSAAIVGLIKPTGEMIKVYQKLGVASGEQLIKKTGSLGDAIWEVTNAAKSANIEIPKLFNRMALKTVSSLNGGVRDNYKSNMAERAGNSDALATAFQKQLGTTAAQAQIAKNNIEQLAIRIGGLLLPALTQIVKIITPVIQSMSDFAHKHKLITGLVVKGALAFGVLAAATAGLSFVIGTITKATWLWSTAVAVMDGVIAILNMELLPLLLLAGGVYVAFKAITGIVSETTDNTIDLNTNIAETRDIFDKIKKPIDNATASLRAYGKAVDDYNSGKILKAIISQEETVLNKNFKGKIFWPWEEGAKQMNALSDKIDRDKKALSNLPQMTPNKLDYGIADSVNAPSVISDDSVGNYIKRNLNDSVGGKIELSIKSDVPVSIDKNTSGITPSIGSTMKPLY